MKMQKAVVTLFVTLAMFLSNVATGAEPQFSTEPTLNDGKKWRLAYYEGGEYRNYRVTLEATIRGLIALGWIEPIALPESYEEQTKNLWKWLSANARSDYLEFVEDSHYSAKWDDDLRNQLAEAFITRLNTTNDIDLVLAMGTWAGKSLANNRHSVPTMVMSTSDPLSSGIIKSLEDSGYDHVHAVFDPFRHQRQLTVFHEIIGFKKLGVAFEDSVNGRSYAAMETIERLSKERGFEIVPCYTQSDISDIKVAEQSVIDCFEELAGKVDAVYLTEQGGVTKRSIPLLVEIANEHKLPTFSQTGSEHVKSGVLVSLSRAGHKYVGDFHARTFAQVFNGAKPNELNQLFQEPPKIAINLKTAEIIGFDPPVVLLGAADEIFDEAVAMR